MACDDTNMMELLVAEVQKALNADCYFAALALALTLPDICGKAEYPEEKSTRKRYIEWYDKHIGAFEKCPTREGELEMPYLSGEVVYSLRNSLLHQGTPNISKEHIQHEENQIDYFALKLEPKNRFEVYSDCSSHTSCNYSDAVTRTYEVNVRRLCFILYRCAWGYYKENKDKFDFFDFHTVGEIPNASAYLPF